MLNSEYRFSWFYLQLCIYALFYLLGFPVFMLPDKFSGLFLTLLTLCTLGACGIYVVLKSAPRLIITSQELIIQHLWNKKKIHRAEIKHLHLISSEEWGFLIFHQLMEATTLETTSGQRFTFYEPFYSNMPAIRLMLDRLAAAAEQGADNNAVLDFTIPPAKEEIIPANETADVFAGYFLRLFGRMAFYELWLLFLIVLIISFNRSVGCLIAAALLLLFLILTFTPQAHYFLVSDNYFLVKNRFRPGFRRIFDTADIKDVKFENTPKRATVLRITTNNFHSYSFAAGTLGPKNWKALQQRLEALNIPVRNEAYM